MLYVTTRISFGNSSNNNLYGPMTCLSTPSGAGCIAGYGSDAPTFLDSTMATDALTKSGYVRGMNYVLTANLGAATFCMLAQPQTINRTGVRSFSGDDAGVIGGTNFPQPAACCILDAAGWHTDTVACPGIK